VSQNYLDFAIFIANISLLELIIFLTSEKLLNCSRMNDFLVKERLEMYWGLLVSYMVQLILPWKYSLFGGFDNYPSMVNLAFQHFILILIPFLLVVSLLAEIKEARRKGAR
jgi:hypothetical protein